MRDIKFRGFGIFEWFYGSLIEDNGFSYIVSEIETSNNYGDGTDFYATAWSEVSPESIGQYIGLKDKNCKEIYEGDIVRKVYDWNDEDPTTFVFSIEDIRWDLNHIIDGESKMFSVEVVGNIYEHPYLLKGESK